MIKIGVTGTRHGMTERQKYVFVNMWCHKGGAVVLLHGDCIGADEQAHWLAAEMGSAAIVYPPIRRELRAFTTDADLTVLEVKPRMSYLARDRAIVDDCDELWAFPFEQQESGGGTWYAIRYARRVGRPYVIVFPDGTREFSNDQLLQSPLDEG